MSERIKSAALLLYTRSLKFMVIAAIWQLALGVVMLFGYLFWNIKMVQYVKSTYPAGAAQTAGMQSGGNRAWVQTSTGMFFLRNPMSITFGEALNLQTRGEGSRYLCSQLSGCTRLLSD